MNKRELPNGYDKDLCKLCTKQVGIVRECSMCPLGDGQDSCRGASLQELIKRTNNYCKNNNLPWEVT